MTVECKGLAELQSKLAEMGQDLAPTLDKAMDGLCQQAAQTATAFYVLYEGGGDPPKAHVVKNGECDYSVIAEGHNVSFAEFGAGYTTDTGFGFSREVPYLVSPGSWSKDHKQMFTLLGWWGYKGVPNGQPIDHITPTRAMFYASQEMQRNIESGDFIRNELSAVGL